MQKLLAQLLPFLVIGIALVAFFLGLMLFVYLLIFGAIVGLALFIINWVKQRFFPPKSLTPTQKQPREGRTFDHDDQS